MSAILLSLILLSSFFSGLYSLTYVVSLKCLESQPVPNRSASPRSLYVPDAVQHQLLSLVNGDWATALTLVDRIRHQYPNKTEQWVWETTIWYLQRDRR